MKTLKVITEWLSYAILLISEMALRIKKLVELGLTWIDDIEKTQSQNHDELLLSLDSPTLQDMIQHIRDEVVISDVIRLLSNSLSIHTDVQDVNLNNLSLNQFLSEKQIETRDKQNIEIHWLMTEFTHDAANKETSQSSNKDTVMLDKSGLDAAENFTLDKQADSNIDEVIKDKNMEGWWYCIKD